MPLSHHAYGLNVLFVPLLVFSTTSFACLCGDDLFTYWYIDMCDAAVLSAVVCAQSNYTYGDSQYM